MGLGMGHRVTVSTHTRPKALRFKLAAGHTVEWPLCPDPRSRAPHHTLGINVTGVTSVSASSAYVNALKVDGVTTPVWWVGGSAPTDGGGSGLDTYSFNIIKTGNGTFHVIGNQVKTS